MTPEQFQTHINRLAEQFQEMFDKHAPTIVGKIAVEHFKKNFQTEAWGKEKWPEVKRRQATWERNGKTIPNPTKGAKRTRKILTGETGDLGRSIEVNKAETGNGKVVIWTNPATFAKSDKIYAAVHNEGLKAGRGAGFIMPKRQFMGDSPELNALIIAELERKLTQLFNKTK